MSCFAHGVSKRIFSIFILIIVVNFTGSCSRNNQYPIVRFDSTEWYLGQIDQDQQMEWNVRISNRGKRVLEIIKVSASCGCTVAELENNKIKPGKSQILKITYNSSNRKGKIQETVMIHTNYPQNPIQQLTLIGEIVPSIILIPDSIQLGKINKGSSVLKEVELLINRNDKIDILGIKSDEPDIKVSYQKIDSKQYKIVLEITPQSVKDPFQSFVQIETSLKHRPSITLPIQGTIIGNLQIEPTAIFIGSLKQEQTIKQIVRIYSTSKIPFSIQSIHTVHPSIIIENVSPKIEKSSNSHTIHIGIKAAKVHDTISDTIKIITDYPGEPELNIPIYARIIP